MQKNGSTSGTATGFDPSSKCTSSSNNNNQIVIHVSGVTQDFVLSFPLHKVSDLPVAEGGTHIRNYNNHLCPNS